jgi:ADP-ribose pyrophosphatase YjhB (NUDIX family)
MNKENNFLRNKYCTNCNNNTHDYKKCPEPITSWGIILIKKTGHTITHNICNLQNDNVEIGVEINKTEDLQKMCEITNNISFLLVRRKHSLGYAEFIRGKYSPDNIGGIQDLFKQMTPTEIQKINDNNNNFDNLWNDFWGDLAGKLTKYNDYEISKKKFNLLKNGINTELNLNFYTLNIKALYPEPEWGIPKGRKQPKETDKECAIREFCEETGLSKSDFKLIDEINPLVEDMIGTNGIAYRHIYYVAEGITDNFLLLENNEIGKIDFFTYENACSIFRDYHVEKKKIIRLVGLYFTNKILKSLTNL